MTRDRKYARVYYDDLEREYPEVWRDPTLRGDYLLLLVAAERAWPSSPEVPRLARPRSAKRLAECGLIFLEPPFHFRARGLDKEREARRRSAAHAAAVRYADRSANGNAGGNAAGVQVAREDALPNQTEPNRTETKIPPPPAKRGRRKDGTNPRATGGAPRQNGTAPRDVGESPRQERDHQKRGGMPEGIGAILARAAAEGRR